MSAQNGNGRGGRGAAGAALDVLLTDAAIGNPVQRLARQPALALSTLGRLARRPDRLALRAAGLARTTTEIALGRSDIAPARSDRRFKDPAWEGNWLLRRVLQAYLAAGHATDELIDDAALDWRADRLARFVAHNVHDVLAPTNFAWSNPAVVKATLDQGGTNLVKGARRAGRDLAARRLPAMVDTSKFKLGENLALSPGAVVHTTELYELIEYEATTPKVHAIPIVVFPPTINKYYILDLAPGRSLVEYLVGRGLRVFMVSWRNPGGAQGDLDFDSYADAVLDAKEVVAGIARRKRVHVVAACSGGLIAAGALAHEQAAGKGQDTVASLTLLVSALDSERAGDAAALTSRELAAAAVAESARHGYLESSALANVFAWLRPNDLIWGYVVNNYLLGQPPPAFDILYWNQDGVRLTAGLHRDFVHMALDNTLAKPGGMTVLGTPVDLGALKVDTYAVAGLNDHIVPWTNAYTGARLLGGTTRFVLSTSGHIQALVNPPGPQSKSSFRRSEDLSRSPEEYLEAVPTQSGSWWDDHADWLIARSEGERRAPARLGNAAHAPGERAPGRYVHAT